jgi:hypothetical protein
MIMMWAQIRQPVTADLMIRYAVMKKAVGRDVRLTWR